MCIPEVNTILYVTYNLIKKWKSWLQYQQADIDKWILKIIWKSQDLEQQHDAWKRTELEDWYCPISRLTIKIQYNPDSTVLVKEE